MWEKHLTRHQREQIKVEETSQKVNLSLEQMTSAHRQASSPLQMLKVTAELDLEAGGPDTIFPLQVEKPPKKFFRSSKEKKEEKLRAQREKEHQEEQRESKAQLMTQREFVEQMIPVVSSEDSSDEAMAAMLKVGAKRLMERPEIQKAYTPQESRLQMLNSYRLLIANKVSDDAAAEELTNQLSEVEKTLTDAMEAQQLAEVAGAEVATAMGDMLSRERMKAVADQMRQTATEDFQTKLQQLQTFEAHLAEAMGKQVQPGEQNLFSGANAIYMDRALQTAYQRQVAGKEETLAPAAAQLAAVREYRQQEAERQRLARQKSQRGALSHSADPKLVEQYGMCSTHHMVTAKEAEEIVRGSHGCVYAEPHKNGLFLLRPTLPETIDINGEKIPLRRDYIALVRGLSGMILNKDGKLREENLQLDENRGNLMDDVTSAITSLSTDTAFQYMNDSLLEVLGDQEAVNKLKADLKKMQNKLDCCPLGNEAVSNFGAYGVSAMKLTRVSLKDRIANINAQKDPSLTPEELEKKKQQEIQCVTQFYLEFEKANEELLKIRSLDLDSPSIPVLNVCSGNASFYSQIKRLIAPDADDMCRLQYATRDQLKLNPVPILDQILKEPKFYADQGDSDAMVARVQALKTQCQKAGGALTQEEREELWRLVDQKANYDYHEAAQVGSYGTETKKAITVEGFAAEAHEYVASPLIMDAGIGLYRDEKRAREDECQGMLKYYSTDLPISGEEMYFRTQRKQFGIPGEN